MPKRYVFYPISVAFTILAIVNPSSAFAEFKEFEANKTGTLTGRALTIQRLKTGTGAIVECTKLSMPESTLTELKPTSLKLKVQYENCSVLIFGAATYGLSGYTELLPKKYSLLTKVATIKASGFGEECEIELPVPQELGAGTAKSGEPEFEYKNATSNGKESIITRSEVEKIKTKILKSTSATNCGTVGEEGSGTFTGEMEYELEGSGNNIKVK